MTAIDFQPERDLYPFASRWFDSSRGRVHYIDEGSGPPIPFSHGNPTWSFLFRNVIADLRDRFRCIAPDYLNFGLSDRPTGYGLPKQILAARPLLQRLSCDVPKTLGAKHAPLVWGMKDFAFDPARTLPRMRATFADREVVKLPDANHFVQEDAPERIAAAIIARFG